MKAIVTFTLPKEQDEFDIYCRARDYHNCLWGIDQQMRGYLKHGHGTATTEDVMELVRSMIAEVDVF